MELEFSGEIVEWRGPAPFFFVPLPPDDAELIDEIKAEVAYWGVVPVTARLGETEFTTAMFPREETWFLPLKAAVRRAEGVGPGEVVDVWLSVGRQPASASRPRASGREVEAQRDVVADVEE